MNRIRISVSRALLFAVPLLVMFSTTLSAAQVSRVGATLEGTVTDRSDAVIPGARVTVRDIETGRTRAVVADAAGAFRFGELSVGTYEIRATHEQFSEYHHAGIVLQLGQTVRLSIQLQPAIVENHVTVTDQPPAIDTTQTTLTTNVDTERIEELPVQSRNYLNFVLLSPGVAESRQQQSAANSAPMGDSGFSFGGLRGRSNTITIDGLDNNDEFTGASRTELSLEIIREFQVVNNGISAETGGASGGTINVITKTGSNTIHGDTFLFLQNGALNARDPLDPNGPAPDLNRYRAGFAIGGPIRGNRTFYYTAFEQEHTRAQQASDINANDIAQINSALASGLYSQSQVALLKTGLFPASRAETEASGKLNHQLSDRHSLMVRYAFTNNREAGDAFNTGALTDASARGSSFTEDHAVVGSLASVLSPSVVNDARFQTATRRVTLRTNDESGPGFEIANIAIFGRPYAGNSNRRENHYEISDALSWNHGTHMLKTGATVNRVGLRASVLDGFAGQYVFLSMDDFLAGRSAAWRQAFGQPNTSFGVTSYGAFLQDYWTPRSLQRLTLNMGVRYDFEQLPSRFNQSAHSFSPRIGLAYSPSDRWVMRAGYGIFFDRYLLGFLNQAVQRDGVTGFEQFADGQSAMNVLTLSAGRPLTAPVADIKPSIYRAAARMSTPYSQQATLGVEHLLDNNTTLSATYLFVRGVKLPRTANVNLVAPAILTAQNAAALGVANPVPQQIGRAVFGQARLDPRYDGVYELQDQSSSTYNGVSLALNRRFSDEVAFSGSYTLSKAIDDASDFYEQPQNPYDLGAERALSRNDQRHRFVFSGLFELPIGDEEEERKPASDRSKPGLLEHVFGHIEFAPIFSIASGRPLNAIVGFDANRSGAWPFSSRPLGMARNSFRSERTINLDFRLVKYFPVMPGRRLDLVAELFNVLNTATIDSYSLNYGPSSAPAVGFGRPIQASRPRQAQFSIDFEF